MAQHGIITNPIFKILINVIHHELFCIFFYYCIKIFSILITELFSVPLNCVSLKSASLLLGLRPSSEIFNFRTSSSSYYITGDKYKMYFGKYEVLGRGMYIQNKMAGMVSEKR